MAIKKNETMNGQQLADLEAESAEMLTMLHEQREEENARLEVPERTFAETTKNSQSVRMLRFSPGWMAAALVIGFAVGFAMPRNNRNLLSDDSYTLAGDTLNGCSVACGDINTALLVSM